MKLDDRFKPDMLKSHTRDFTLGLTYNQIFVFDK
jgi:hypothetical protein